MSDDDKDAEFYQFTPPPPRPGGGAPPTPALAAALKRQPGWPSYSGRARRSVGSLCHRRGARFKYAGGQRLGVSY